MTRNLLTENYQAALDDHRKKESAICPEPIKEPTEKTVETGNDARKKMKIKKRKHDTIDRTIHCSQYIYIYIYIYI